MADKDILSRKEHRTRIRKRIREGGLRSLQEHEVVEYILMMCIPQKDVKPLAYELLNKYKSFSGIFDAGYDELMTVSGISEYSATFLSNFPELVRMYSMSLARNDGKNEIRSSAAAAEYCKGLFMGRRDEAVFAITLDKQFYVIQDNLMHTGTLDEVSIYVREVVEIATRQKASCVLLAHNHPSKNYMPSEQDVIVTKQIKAALSTIHTLLMDHIIITDLGSSSLRNMGYLDDDKPEPANEKPAKRKSGKPRLSIAAEEVRHLPPMKSGKKPKEE